MRAVYIVRASLQWGLLKSFKVAEAGAERVGIRPELLLLCQIINTDERASRGLTHNILPIDVLAIRVIRPAASTTTTTVPIGWLVLLSRCIVAPYTRLLDLLVGDNVWFIDAEPVVEFGLLV